MPRKAKEKINELNNPSEEKTIDLKKKVSTSKVSKSTSSKTKTSSTTATKKTTKLKTSTTTKNKSTKSDKTTKKSRTTTKAKTASTIVEYYDLPFRYNQTIVKILAQTPNTLFIYWDISDNDRKSYIEKYGEDFFNHTKPYLIITNETMNYTFEVEINDFANSWYLHVTDANCKYKVELGRKFIVNSTNNTSKFEPYYTNDYISITFSNEIESPNNRILFDKLGNSVFFRNIKTNIVEEKNISSLSFLQNIGRIYNIYDLYKKIYSDELVSDEFGVNLPSSNSSSTFK